MTVTVTADQAHTQMCLLTDLGVRALTAEMRAAAYVLAKEASENHPTAVQVHLEPSDQGEWLSLLGWADATGTHHDDLTVSDDAEDAPAHLYLAHIGRQPDASAVPGLWQSEQRPERYTLDIDRVLREYTAPTVAEVLTVRDPDGGTTVELTILGKTPDPATVAEFAIDAGRGWQWPEWVEHRDASLAAASDDLRPHLEEWFADPPGGKYIEHRPDGADWLTAPATGQDDD